MKPVAAVSLICDDLHLIAIIDTTIVWTFSGIAIALMTIPNIIGILLLRKEMKETVADYWATMDFSNEDK